MIAREFTRTGANKKNVSLFVLFAGKTAFSFSASFRVFRGQIRF
jgi:hypothetical protein